MPKAGVAPASEHVSAAQAAVITSTESFSRICVDDGGEGLHKPVIGKRMSSPSRVDKLVMLLSVLGSFIMPVQPPFN